MPSHIKELPGAPPPAPTIWAVPFGRAARGEAVELLSPREQRQVAAVATLVQAPRNRLLCEEGQPALSIFNLVEGVVESCLPQPDGRRQVLAFLFAHDLFGLSENGRYTSTVRTVTPVRAWRIPLDALEVLLRRDPTFEFHLLCKFHHDLRMAQRQMAALWHKSASSRLARFLILLARQMHPGTRHPDALELPMRRQDIADFLGLSAESVSRATRELSDAGVLRAESPRRIEVLDWRRLARHAGMI